MKIGVFGVGRIGSRHAASLASLPDVESVLVCDADPQRARIVATDIGGVLIADPSEMLQRGVDALVIATATPAHAPLVHAAADARLPVFCEKPLAPTLKETLLVLEHVEESRIPVTVGFHRRCDPGFIALREHVRSGRLGRPYLIRVVAADASPLTPSDYLPGSGGIFRDQILHDFDLLRWISGAEVTEVYAVGDVLTGRPEFHECADHDTVAAVLRMSDGTLATLTGSRDGAGGYDARVEIAGSQGLASVASAFEPGDGDAGGLFHGHNRYTGFLDRFAEAYRAEMERFVDLVAGRGENVCPGRAALEAMRIAEAADRSRAERRPVRPEEVGA